MIALHEKKHYVSPENDVFMVQYEDTMFPEDMYDELLEKIEDKPKKMETEKNKKVKKEEGARVSKKKRKESKKASKKGSKKKSH